MEEHEDHIYQKEKFTCDEELIGGAVWLTRLKTLPSNFDLEGGIVETLNARNQWQYGYEDITEVVYLIVSSDNEIVHEAFRSTQLRIVIPIVKILLL